MQMALVGQRQKLKGIGRRTSGQFERLVGPGDGILRLTELGAQPSCSHTENTNNVIARFRFVCHSREFCSPRTIDYLLFDAIPFPPLPDRPPYHAPATLALPSL